MALPPKWYQFLVAVFASLGSYLYGYDLGVIAEVVASNTFTSKFSPDATQSGLVVSMFTTGAFFGAFMGGPSGDYLGRRITIVIGARHLLSWWWSPDWCREHKLSLCWPLPRRLGCRIPGHDHPSLPGRARSSVNSRSCYLSAAIHARRGCVGGSLDLMGNIRAHQDEQRAMASAIGVADHSCCFPWSVDHALPRVTEVCICHATLPDQSANHPAGGSWTTTGPKMLFAR